MNRMQRGRSRPRVRSVLVAMLLAGGAAAVLFVPFHSASSFAGPTELAGSAIAVAMTEGTEPGRAAPEGCTAAQLVDPGQYESIERSGSASATWVIIPDTYELMVPAPLYVLSAIGFTGSTDDLDRLSPVFGALDGVVLVTAVEGSDDEFATLLDEVLHDFCIDPHRIVTSMVPLPGSQMPREADVPTPGSRHTAA